MQIENTALRLFETDPKSDVRKLETARSRDPRSVELLQPVAICYEKVGRTLDALITLDQIIQQEDADDLTWSTTGRLATRHREYAQAVLAFEQALRLAPNAADLRPDYGKTLYQLGDVAEAARQMGKACELTDELIPGPSLATIAPGNPYYCYGDVLRIRRKRADRLRGMETQRTDAAVGPRSEKLRIGYLSSCFHRENYMKWNSPSKVVAEKCGRLKASRSSNYVEAISQCRR